MIPALKRGQLEAYLSSLGYLNHPANAIQDYLKDLLGLSGSYHTLDLWNKFLTEQGFTGTLADKEYQWMVANMDPDTGLVDLEQAFNSVASILNSSEFYAPLTHSLILTRGTGDPTYARATTAWEFDNEGKLITVPSTAARFGGARMVRNLLAATGTLSTQNVTTIAASYTLSFYGTGSVTLSGTATGTLNGTGASTRVQTTVTATAGTLTLTVSGSVTDAQLENVTGQADQTASEYVSVGVLSAPYHGAGVDGVKYFDTNKDGSAISTSTLLGYHAEGGRTNNLLYSRNLTNAAWVKTNVTATNTCTGIDNAANSASTLTAGAADATIMQTLTLAAAARSFSAYVKRRTGTGNIYITRDGGTSWTDVTADINGTTWSRVKIENTSVLNPSVGFKIATSGDEIDVDVCQDEAGAFASSPIITTTAAVTRNVDVLYYSGSNVTDTAGTFRVIATPAWPNSSGTDHILFDAQSTGNGLGRYSGGAIQWHDSSSTYVSFSPNMPWDGSSARTIGVAWESNTAKGTYDAGTISDIATITLTFDRDAYIGVRTEGASPFFGHIKETYIWQSALTDDQLQQVTA